MLTRLTLTNYRCFRDVSLDFQELTLLIGGNGTGKSTVLDIIAGLRAMIVEGERVDVALDGDPKGDGDTCIEVDVSLGVDSLRYRLVLANSGSDRRITCEEVSEVLAHGALRPRYRAISGQVYVDGAELGVRMRTDTSPLSALDLPSVHPVTRLRNWLNGVWLLRLIPQDMEASAEEPDDHLNADGGNFNAWFLGFTEEQRLRVHTSLASVIPGLSALDFEKVGRAQVLVAHFAQGFVVDFDELSDGQRALIVLHAVFLLVGDATLLLLDEPDANVTATEILPLVSRIREATEAGRLQALIVSHHPHMLDLLASDDVLELAYDDAADLKARPLQLDDDAVKPSRYILLRGA